jgi:DNA repair protein RadD
MFVPFDYQLKAVESVRAAFSEGLKRVVVQAPTGAGKTVILLLIAAACVANKKRVLFVVHLNEILDDFVDRANAWGQFQIGSDVNVISIQSATRGTKQLPEADVILCDEVQHLPAKTFSRLLELYPDAFIVGASATPCRGDDKPLSMFERLIVAAKYSELLQRGRIVNARVYQPQEHKGGNLALDPVVAYERYGEGSSGFVFVRGISQCEELAERFRVADVPAEAVHSKLSTERRRVALRNLRSGATRLLISDAILTEGVDCPAARVCILACPCHFVGGYMQRVGRVLRACDGKPDAIVIDLVGSSIRHGLPTIDREFSLTGKSYDITQLPALRVCLQCGLTQLSGRTSCEGCDFVFPRIERAKPKIFSEELKAVFDFENTPLNAKSNEWHRLLDLALIKSYSVDWCVSTYAATFGEKPPTVWLSELPPDRKRLEFERWAQEGRSRNAKPGYPYARFKATFGTAPPR